MKRNDTVTVVISTRVKDENYISHVKKMFSHPKNQYLIYENDNKYSLSELYNKGLSESENDIVIFMHDDLIINSKNLTPKIIKMFEKNEDFGIIGIAGTDKLTSGTWWENKENLSGIVNHITDKGKEYTSFFSKQQYIDNPKEVIVVDGLFVMVNKRRIKHTFNEQFKSFHFYDLPICVENYLDGVKVGVTTKFKITHKSPGPLSKDWQRNKLLFEALYEKNFPITC